MDIKRGEIYYIARGGYGAVGSEYESGRPGIIVSNDANNRHSPIVEIVYLTTQPKKEEPTHVTIRSGNRVSTAICEQVTTVSIERIGDMFGICSEEEMAMVDLAIIESLELSSYLSKKPADTIDDKSKEIIASLKAELDTYKTLYAAILDRVMAR